MKFVDKLLSFLKKGFQFILDGLGNLIDLLKYPLGFLMSLLEGIFYFIAQVFNIVIQIIMLFVALFQYLFSVVKGVFRTITSWLTINPNPNDVSFPSTTSQGFKVLVEQLQPTGMMTVVPLLCLAFLWFYFILKIIGLLGGSIQVRVHGGSKD